MWRLAAPQSPGCSFKVVSPCKPQHEWEIAVNYGSPQNGMGLKEPKKSDPRGLVIEPGAHSPTSHCEVSHWKLCWCSIELHMIVKWPSQVDVSTMVNWWEDFGKHETFGPTTHFHIFSNLQRHLNHFLWFNSLIFPWPKLYPLVNKHSYWKRLIYSWYTR